MQGTLHQTVQWRLEQDSDEKIVMKVKAEVPEDKFKSASATVTESILAENVNGDCKSDSWNSLITGQVLVQFVPLLSRTNSWRSSTCIRFTPYLESAGRTASATLVLDRAHSSSIKSMLLKT